MPELKAKPKPPPPGGPSATAATFLAIVDRLEATVVAETDALSRNQPFDRLEANRHKRQGLLELNRALRAVAGTSAAAEARARLSGLAGTLESNRRVLEIQLRAVGEVAEIIARAMKEAESDGTYSPRGVR